MQAHLTKEIKMKYILFAFAIVLSLPVQADCKCHMGSDGKMRCTGPDCNGGNGGPRGHQADTPLTACKAAALR